MSSTVKCGVNPPEIHSQSTFIQLTPHFTELDIWREFGIKAPAALQEQRRLSDRSRQLPLVRPAQPGCILTQRTMLLREVLRFVHGPHRERTACAITWQ